jgi:hypothetical protein
LWEISCSDKPKYAETAVENTATISETGPTQEELLAQAVLEAKAKEDSINNEWSLRLIEEDK